MNIETITRKAMEFRSKLDRVKATTSLGDFEWYRYDSLSNWIHIEKLLTGENREFDRFLSGKPILDIGCADGDLAFFLESLGYEVTVVDYPVTNHNHMAGVRKLKEVLGSRVEILSMDVDTQFVLPAKSYGLAIVLGAIYHLKNPFYLLEAVSKQASHTLVSTRIASRLPGTAQSLKTVPLAYLLGTRELNQDWSNYWIFTESGFTRLMERTNWDVLDLKSFGDIVFSDPVNADHDERIFCLARSRYALANVDLIEGWHKVEGSGWRWTEQKFAVRIRMPKTATQAALKLKLYLPPELISQWGSVTLESSAGPPVTYTEGGYQEAAFSLSKEDREMQEIRFSLDRFVPGDATDNRERGIIVHSVEVI